MEELKGTRRPARETFPDHGPVHVNIYLVDCIGLSKVMDGDAMGVDDVLVDVDLNEA